jgi:penicillin-binding protein 1A
MTKHRSVKQIRKNRKKKRTGHFWKIANWSFWIVTALMSVGAGAAFSLYSYMGKGLPKITTLKDYRPPIITTIYSDDNRKIAEFFDERRIIVPFHDIPEKLKQAFIAAEDARFYKHQGIDLVSIARAFFKNLEAGTIVQGGSTITQQVTKSFFLSPERSYERKIKEAILAYRIDKTLSKEEILYLYLNQIYLGHGAYGVAAAADNYFNKKVADLNLAECAMLAGLPQAPSRYSPFKYPERARDRQTYVLNRMVAEGYISNLEASDALSTKLDIRSRRNWYLEKVPLYTEHVRRYVEKKYGRDTLYREGLKVYTGVNIEMQKAAHEEVLKGTRDLDRRQGYRGPIKHLKEEKVEDFFSKDNEPPPLLNVGKKTQSVVIAVDDKTGQVTVRLKGGKGRIELEDIRWARKPNPEIAYYEDRLKKPSDALAVGDVIEVMAKGEQDSEGFWPLSLEQTPKVQGALLCIEAETGLVKVMIGGRNFRESQFNRAIQSRRQPGSSFKPIIYAAAIDKGYTAATEIIDSPIIFKDEINDFTWKPKNYGKKFYGPTLLREALAKSRNVVTIKVLQDIGIDYAIDYARKLGITSHLSKDLSIALGSSGVSLLEIVNSYSVFANQGNFIEPSFVTKIVDRDGNVLEEMNPDRKKVIEKSTAYIMTTLLEGVVQNGTGHRIKALGRPVAGKTGTTNDLYDAWFVGYTPELITGTWVGYDDKQSLGEGETGSRAASPIWLGFMRQALKEKPVRVFPVPEGVVFAKIDAETGLLPIPASQNTIFECFKEGTVPTALTPKPDTFTGTDDFFKSDM